MNTAKMTEEILNSGWTQSQVGAFCGVNQSTVGRWKKGLDPEGPNRDKLLELYRSVVLGEDPRPLSYLPIDKDDGEDDSGGQAGGFTRDHWKPKTPGAIPELDISAGAGEGTVGNVIALPMSGGTISAHEVVEEWPFPPNWLREVVSDVGLTIITPVNGDSMVPNYMPGDRVIVDLSQDHLLVDGVYLISYDMGPPQIKRLQRVPLTVPPKVSIKSDNPAYDTFEVELDLLRIHGRICASVGRR